MLAGLVKRSCGIFCCEVLKNPFCERHGGDYSLNRIIRVVACAVGSMTLRRKRQVATTPSFPRRPRKNECQLVRATCWACCTVAKVRASILVLIKVPNKFLAFTRLGKSETGLPKVEKRK